jgi:hypothetical protein
MTAEQFAYWLQGFAELNLSPPTQEQWQSIREHVATVFAKKTPPVAVDLSGNKGMRDLIESARERQGYQPWPPTPTPGFWLDQSIKPGVLTC